MFSGNQFKYYWNKKKVTGNLKRIVSVLAEDIGERNLKQYDSLNRAKNFIIDYFESNGFSPEENIYTVDGKEVSNIIAEVRGFDEPDEIIVLGAHYDTAIDTPGADDNATGVAGLLEIFRLLSKFRFRKTIRFVAFTLEEPPFFSTELMGSMQYASLCKENNDNIELMICLEMIGYGSKKIKQEIPINNSNGRYPPCGDFLAVVSFSSMHKYINYWKRVYNSFSKHKIFDLAGPASVSGISLSDHSSFIKMGFPAIMITDTGFYRNKNYHTPGDLYNTINFRFLSSNVINSCFTIRNILNSNLCDL